MVEQSKLCFSTADTPNVRLHVEMQEKQFNPYVCKLCTVFNRIKSVGVNILDSQVALYIRY